jgi:cytochrome c peroxidase
MKTPVLICTILALTIGTAATAKQGYQPHKKPAAVSDQDFYDDGSPPQAKVTLGQMLFFDKILSGNLNISCATCHHSLTDTGDGLSLPIGEGGMGLGVTRDTGGFDSPVPERVPRNAPPVFNLGARHFTRLFHDGRVEPDSSQPNRFVSPAGADLPPGLDNVLAVQAMFPVTSGTEMAGQAGENPQADAAAVGDLLFIWDFIAKKLQDIPGYLPLFAAAYPGEISAASDITYVHAANAIAAFEAAAWRFDNSPYDRYLRRDNQAMSAEAMRGMQVFNGKAGCAECHSGAFQTDDDFHAIAMPQIGPGKGDGIDGLDDFGRERVTLDPADRYRFRTPTLRNVALTAPYGHAGAYDTLEAVVWHHLDPVASLHAYDPSQATLPSRPDLDAHDFSLMSDPARRDAIAAANELQPVHLSDREFSDLLAFLNALTDEAAIDLRKDVPASVPSGLPLAD